MTLLITHWSYHNLILSHRYQHRDIYFGLGGGGGGGGGFNRFHANADLVITWTAKEFPEFMETFFIPQV